MAVVIIFLNQANLDEKKTKTTNRKVESTIPRQSMVYSIYQQPIKWRKLWVNIDCLGYNVFKRTLKLVQKVKASGKTFIFKHFAILVL